MAPFVTAALASLGLKLAEKFPNIFSTPPKDDKLLGSIDKTKESSFSALLNKNANVEDASNTFLNSLGITHTEELTSEQITEIKQHIDQLFKTLLNSSEIQKRFGTEARLDSLSLIKTPLGLGLTSTSGKVHLLPTTSPEYSVAHKIHSLQSLLNHKSSSPLLSSVSSFNH